MTRLQRTVRHLLTALLLVLVVFSRAAAVPVENGGGLIPDLLVSMDGRDLPAYALVVEKSIQRLSLIKYDGRYQVVETMRCSTGKINGNKMVSGDKKTPAGAYFFTQAFKAKDLAPLYGTRAFPLDYPNLMDRRHGRNGYAIWLHGTNRPLKDRDSNGCIALENRDIDRLSAHITLRDTPILIAKKVSYRTTAQAETEEKALHAFLSGWNRALASGSYHEYLAFYDSGYLPAISWWMQWLDNREAGPLSAGAIDTRLQYRGIYKDRGLFVVLFDLQLSLGDLTAVAGRRKIFVTFETDTPRIVGDTFLATAPAGESVDTTYSLVSTARALRSRQTGKEAIAALVDKWLQAWSGKDIKGYGASYSMNFRSKQMDKQKWLDYKARLNKTYRYINVSAENTRITRSKGTATVTFMQTYESNVHTTKGMKTLTLKLEDGKWKIFRETFTKN